MDVVIETRWTRYGHDRVYVKTSDGLTIGHVDLKTGSVDAKVPELASALDDCKRRWLGGTPDPVAPRSTVTSLPPPPAPPEPTAAAISRSLPPPPPPMVGDAQPAPLPPPPPTTLEPAVVARDLASNPAGAAAKAKRDEINAQAPVLNLVARVFGVKTDERNWRVGAVGEQKVGKELDKLGPHWRVLHAVEVGDRGADIDHVVIGPAGVFTLNTKRHPKGTAWVAERAVRVNRHPTDYLRNSHHEGARATRLLTAACGFQVKVLPVIVFVDLAEFEVKQQPAGVHVTTCKRLIDWLERLPITMDSATIETVFDTARLSTTWAGK